MTTKQRGFTLTELMVTMSLGSGLMMLAVGLVHQTMRLTSEARWRAAEHRTIWRLVDQFRRDVHRADAVVVDSPESIRMVVAGLGDVTYTVRWAGCDRVVGTEQETGSSHESYRLQAGGQITFESLREPDRVAMTIGRGGLSPRLLASDSSDSPTTTADGDASVAAVAPPRLRIEAVIGRRVFRSPIVTAEESP